MIDEQMQQMAAKLSRGIAREKEQHPDIPCTQEGCPGMMHYYRDSAGDRHYECDTCNYDFDC